MKKIIRKTILILILIGASIFVSYDKKEVHIIKFISQITSVNDDKKNLKENFTTEGYEDLNKNRFISIYEDGMKDNSIEKISHLKIKIIDETKKEDKIIYQVNVSYNAHTKIEVIKMNDQLQFEVDKNDDYLISKFILKEESSINALYKIKEKTIR